MNTRFSILTNTAKISLLLLGVLMISCNALKRVEEDELLLTKNTILADDEKVTEEDVHSLIVQKPNSSILGYPFRLNLYNLAKENPDSSYQAWLHKTEKREKHLINWLSKKQVDRLGESFLVKGYSEWLKNVGEAPVTIDTALTNKSAKRLKAFYDSKGYFNNTANYYIVPTKRKQRAAIEYNVTLGKPFILDTITYNISSPAIDSIFNAHKEASYIKQKDQFNVLAFNTEKERLTSLFRNSGVYNFQESSISYDIARDTTRLRDDQDMEVTLNISNLKQRSNGGVTQEYKVHTFDRINIYADYVFGQDVNTLQSKTYNNYTIYYPNKLRYKPKAITDAIFIKQDSIYRELDRLRTYRQINNLNTFKYPNIEISPADSTDAALIANIYLSPRAKYSLSTDLDVTHSNIQRLGVSFSSALVTRNVFGGTETLSLSARGTVGLLGDTSISEDYFSEIGGDINLTFPRIWFPIFNTSKIIRNYMLPQSRLSVGTSFQKNIGLDKQTFNSILGYNWSPNDYKKHAIELLNLQFVRNVNPGRFFNVYQNSYERLDAVADSFQDNPEYASFYEDPNNTGDPYLIIPTGTTAFTNEVLNNGLLASNSSDFEVVRSIEERRQRLTENNLIFASNYTFTKNNRVGITDNNFYQFRFKLESAGNLLSAMTNIVPFNTNENNDYLVFGVPYSQYVKTELDYIKHWSISGENTLAFRSFFGIAIPYGNSDNIPFTRSYFGGGSNDNRAWNAYSLGPGRTQEINDFNEANLKIALNLEYRFPIIGDIKGAFFADAGNIWNVLDNVENEDAVFSGLKSLEDIALGTGFGLRYDFSYFVFRLDTGFKTYNPAEEFSKRWFRDYNFANAVFNIGINYPF